MYSQLIWSRYIYIYAFVKKLTLDLFTSYQSGPVLLKKTYVIVRIDRRTSAITRKKQPVFSINRT